MIERCGLESLRSGARNFLSRVNFLCRLLFRHPFHSRVIAVAHTKSRSFCQKCRWQVTAKHTCTLRVWLCMKWHGAWLYGVHRTRRDGCSFMWHRHTSSVKYITSVDIHERVINSWSFVYNIESHASAVSLIESGE